MRNLEKKLRAAIVQAAPVFFDKQATLQKVVHQIEEAGRNGAQLIVFPESLVPCYPYGLTFGFTVGILSEAERDEMTYSLYCSNVILAPDGTLTAHHRKINRMGQTAISGLIHMTRRRISPWSRRRGVPWAR